jgi:DNA ligase-associated metallophosphoesterase
METINYNYFNNSFSLHYLKAMYWHDHNALLIADLHLGKQEHFRKSGIAVPNTNNNFNNLIELINYYNPAKVIFLGDLFHSTKNNSINDAKILFQNLKCELILVKGNHDILNNHIYSELNINVVDDYYFNGIKLNHEPPEDPNSPVICGHIHPAITLKGEGRNYIKLPCFYFSDNIVIMPAFGDFTGTYKLSPKRTDKIFAISENELIEF